MKLTIIIATSLFVLAIVLGLLQLWFTAFDPVLFVKLEMTLGALLVGVTVVGFVAKEYQQDRINRRGDHLN